ncbi:hypothetical protein MC885_006976 [Smutsia gigantea]|nr:hypothetical protein MC885_006976 [Smutsia gigantea]
MTVPGGAASLSAPWRTETKPMDGALSLRSMSLTVTLQWAGIGLGPRSRACTSISNIPFSS